MERQEHLQWCKQRALEYLETGDTVNAVASMLSDLTKHEGTKDHPGLQLSVICMIDESIDNTRKFIEGFN